MGTPFSDMPKWYLKHLGLSGIVGCSWEYTSHIIWDTGDVGGFSPWRQHRFQRRMWEGGRLWKIFTNRVAEFDERPDVGVGSMEFGESEPEKSGV